MYGILSSSSPELTYVWIGVGVIVVLALILFLTPKRPDLDLIYRKMIYEHFLRIGFKKDVCELISNADQNTIDRFLKLTEIVDRTVIEKL